MAGPDGKWPMSSAFTETTTGAVILCPPLTAKRVLSAGVCKGQPSQLAAEAGMILASVSL